MKRLITASLILAFSTQVGHTQATNQDCPTKHYSTDANGQLVCVQRVASHVEQRQTLEVLTHDFQTGTFSFSWHAYTYITDAVDSLSGGPPESMTIIATCVGSCPELQPGNIEADVTQSPTGRTRNVFERGGVVKWRQTPTSPEYSFNVVIEGK